jgi:hypothetical protein
MTIQRENDYEPLLPNPEEGKEDLTERPPVRRRLGLATILTSPHHFFLACCSISLVLSALNLSFISAYDAFNSYAFTRSPKQRPSVYLGLEHLRWKRPRCRTRITYPMEYALVEHDRVAQKQRVHAARDEVMFGFGDEVSSMSMRNLQCMISVLIDLRTPRVLYP